MSLILRPLLFLRQIFPTTSTTVQAFNSCTSRPDVSQCLVVLRPLITCLKRKPSTSMAHVAYYPMLRSVARSSMHPCPEKWVVIGCRVVYYARAAHAFSAGIKCRHCNISGCAQTVTFAKFHFSSRYATTVEHCV